VVDKLEMAAREGESHRRVILLECKACATLGHIVERRDSWMISVSAELQAAI